MRRIIIRKRVRSVSATRAKARGIRVVNNETFSQFNPSVLGLGNISLPSKEVEAIVAAFDLSGFTKFCSRVDPHLAVPEYLSQFLGWLFDKVKIGLTATNYSDRKAMWADLPFLSKFTGDGVLFLWNTRNMSEKLICGMVSTLYEICYAYKHQFYPRIRKAVANPPDTLRCGIARGRVFSVGNGRDYVGHCVNLASRLQKLSLLTFCFPRQGFDVTNYMRGSLRERLAEKRVTIKGIWESDLVWVLKEEFDSLPDKERELFGEP